MRVLQVAWEYPPLVYGGLARHVEGLSRALAARGCEVTVVTQRHADASVDAVVDGVRVVRVDAGLALEDLLRFVESLGRAQAAAVSPLGRFDVVHAHDWHAAAAAHAVARSCNARLVATLHATEWGRHAGRLPTPLSRSVHEAERRLAQRADQVLVCSAAMAEEVRTLFGVAAAPVRNGVDVAAWTSEARRERGLIVAAGRLEWEKGFSTLLRSLPGLRALQPDVRVVLAGRGTYEPTLRGLAQELGVADIVDFAGWHDRSQLADLYARASVVAVPSRYEPSGLVAMEAVAAGAPVVVTRVGGLLDLVEEGLAAGSVPPGDVDGLSGLLDVMLDGGDEALRRAALARDRLSASQSWHAVAAQTLRRYRAG